MNKGYDIFVSQIEEAIVAFPSLHQVIVDGKYILKGALAVIDKNGRHWEDYEIEIHSTENFPNEFPLLFESSGKIPKITDWHVYEDTLSCCVKIKPEELLRCKKGITVTDYIREEVVPYLFNQTHRRVEGYYVNGEYGHGTLGIYEYYSNLLNTGKNIERTIQLMLFIAKHERPGRTTFCFCGRNIKFRDCHRAAYDKLKQLDAVTLESHAYSFAKAAGFI
jgi:hypothetical protein